MTDFRLPLFERLEIETQSNCNRSCWFCPRTYDRSGAYLDARGEPILQQMSTDKIIDILEQAKSLKFQGLVNFHFYSEPLLDKRSIFLAREARKRRMKPFLHTNGDVLKDNEALRDAVSETYEYIVIGIYDYDSNEELEGAKEAWRKKMGGADLRFSAISDRKTEKVKSMGVPRALVPTSRRFPVPDLTFTNGPCHRPLIRLLLRYDGEMCFCCEDMQADFDLGNVYEHNREELWFSEKHIQVASDLLEGRRQRYELYQNCPLSPTAELPHGEQVELKKRHYS